MTLKRYMTVARARGTHSAMLRGSMVWMLWSVVAMKEELTRGWQNKRDKKREMRLKRQQKKK